MAGKDNKTLRGLFTESADIDPALRDIALSIRARFGSEFRTAAFASEGPGGTDLCWREAWEDPATKLWSVQEYEGATLAPLSGGRNENAFSGRIVYSGITLFDALHDAAKFEIAQRDLCEAVPVPRRENAALPHFRDFAAKEGIPLGGDDLPLIAAQGRILSKGKFSGTAIEIARGSKGNTGALPVPEETVSSLFRKEALPVPAVAAGDIGVQLAVSAGRQEILRQMDVLYEKLKESRKADFRKIDRGAVEVFCIPVFGQLIWASAAFYSLYKGHNEFSASHTFRIYHRRFDGMVKEIPDGEYRTALQSCADDFIVAFHVLRARHRCREKVRGKNYMKNLNDILAAFETDLKGTGMPEAGLPGFARAALLNANDMTIDSRIMEKLEKRIQSFKETASKAPGARPRNP